MTKSFTNTIHKRPAITPIASLPKLEQSIFGSALVLNTHLKPIDAPLLVDYA
ncbi:hypothetical protein [Bradyrhizobium sp. CCGUVB23]|uniref:hypothetical protein n=1 Tax=Bradyrhizobium sp. CCGUVB23 TaxID=2949630 RepID=UPI0020B2D802|nr:hypothetical protein [Bradyrhizobium sp. CCGUVB23]MCP3468412.1 hypothetical protein [Bradyrhizobium sp. CCGUVB23]